MLEPSNNVGSCLHAHCLWLGSDGAGWGPTQFLDHEKFMGSCLPTMSPRCVLILQVSQKLGWFMSSTLIRHPGAPWYIPWLQEKLWLYSHFADPSSSKQAACHRKQPSSPHRVAYYALCLTGFTVTWSACDAEHWPGSHESTASIPTSALVTRWTDFHPSDLNEPLGNLDLNHHCLLFTLAGEAALMMYGPTAVAEI